MRTVINTAQALWKFIAQAEPKFIRVLGQIRKGVQDAISYADIRNMILTGELDEVTIEAIQQGYGAKLSNHLRAFYEQATDLAISELLKYLDFDKDSARQRNLAKFVYSRGAELVTRITEEQKRGLKEVLYHFTVKEPIGYDKLSKYIRPLVGLTQGQRNAVERMRQALVAEGKTEYEILKAITKYAEELHRYRAVVIARTELSFAYNNTSFDIVHEQTSKAGIYTRKKWYTAHDERVCEVCGALDGKTVEMNSNFRLGKLGKEEDISFLPPAHPNCRCTIIYEMEH